MCIIERISCRNYVVIDGYAYFSNWFYNGLFKVEILTGRTFFLGCFDGEKYTERNLHWEVFSKNKKIYFCPRRSRYIHIYNLEKESLCSLEIRRKSEKFFRIENVVLNRNNLFLIPGENVDFICQLDVITLKVTRIGGELKPEGVSLSKCKENFPARNLIYKYDIERPEGFWWRQVFQGIWYGFLPLGSHLLKYTEGRNDLEIIPLFVVNETMLKEYLCHVEWQRLMERPILAESREADISTFLDVFTKVKKDKHPVLRTGQSSGKRVWEVLKDRKCQKGKI